MIRETSRNDGIFWLSRAWSELGCLGDSSRQGGTESCPERGMGVPGTEHGLETELGGLGQPAVGVAGVAPLPGQAELSEGAQRPAPGARLYAPGGRGDCERYRQVGAGLVH